MKQKILLIRLAFKLGVMFLNDFYEESKREIANKALYPQSNYGSCLERSTAILSAALKRPFQVYALAIANHRLCSHGDSVVSEVRTLEVGLSAKDVKVGTYGWWMM